MIATTPRPEGRRRPAWLAAPGRWAGLGRNRSRAVLAAIAVLVLAALIAARIPTPDPIDGSLGTALADGLRHGGEFYAIAADSARAAGLAVSARTVPLPTLFVIEGHVPALLVPGATMMLAVLVVLGWYARFGGVLARRRARLGALLLMLVGMAVALRPSLMAVPEAWAGMLVALSLARWAPDRWIEPPALGLAAAMLSPTALPFALVMMLAAWRERRGREALGWLVVLLAGGAAIVLHARALATVAAIGADPVGAGGLGLGDTLAALGWATGLRALPLGLAMPAVLLATAGWASRREPVASRVAALIVVQAGLIAVLGQPDAALVVAPLLPLGLLAIPDAWRDLTAAALDTRRITVTRVTR